MTDKSLPVNTAPSFQSYASLTSFFEITCGPPSPPVSVLKTKWWGHWQTFVRERPGQASSFSATLSLGVKGGSAAPKPYATMRACIYWQTFVRHQYPGQSKSLLRNLVAVVVGGVGVGVGSGAGEIRASV